LAAGQAITTVLTENQVPMEEGAEVLVEWSVPEQERLAVIQEVYLLIRSECGLKKGEPSDGPISSADLPPII
jgi:hypothetical protein